MAGADADRVRRHVLIFEFVDGGTVASAIEDKVLPWAEPKVRSEISGLLRLLAEMHNVGITHRDITPANVFLRNGRLALGDFGISRMALNPREATVTAYTPAYVPRSMESRYLWGPAEDLYQMGLLTCTLLSGEDWDRHRINELLVPRRRR